MTYKNKPQRTSKTKLLKKPAKNRFINISLLIVIVVIIAGTGTYVALTIKNATTLYESVDASQSRLAPNEPIKTKIDEDTSVIDKDASVKPTDTTIASEREFSFANTSGWTTQNSRDGSFSVKYIQNLVYETCPDLSDNLMIAMVYLSESKTNCGSLQEAVSMQPHNGRTDTTILLTETMIAQTSDILERGGAKPVAVTLAGGQEAQRYEYSSIILGKYYYTIEYETVVGGKRYVALNNWQYTKDPNMSSVDFDTMIQKTWMFN